MRFFVFVFGIVVGVAATLAYVMFEAPTPIQAPAALPNDPEITVTLGERFLTEMIRRASVDVPGVTVAPDLRVELRDDTIVVHATVEVLGRPTEGTAVLQPRLRDGHLTMEVIETNVGALPMPATEQVLERAINTRIESLLHGVPVAVTGASVDRAHGLTITCRVTAQHVAR
ncbi:MAG: hypothetical protein ABI867_36660 [Kofleriaceae bacterium]